MSGRTICRALLPPLGLLLLSATAAKAMFLSTDPVGTKDDPNLYMYVGLDPVNKTDPTGMEAWRLYRTFDEAFEAAGNDVWDASLRTSSNPFRRLEYGTRILRTSDGQFLYGDIVPGTPENVDIERSAGRVEVFFRTGKRSRIVGEIHSHPATTTNHPACARECRGPSDTDRENLPRGQIGGVRTANGIVRYRTSSSSRQSETRRSNTDNRRADGRMSCAGTRIRRLEC